MLRKSKYEMEKNASGSAESAEWKVYSRPRVWAHLFAGLSKYLHSSFAPQTNILKINILRMRAPKIELPRRNAELRQSQ